MHVRTKQTGAAIIAAYPDLPLDVDHDVVDFASRHRTCALCRHRPWLGGCWLPLRALEAYSQVQAVSAAWYGRLVLFGYTWALFHHMFGGIRHFIWDTGRGFDLKHVEILARITAFVPPLLTLGVWVAAYAYLGVL